MTRTTEHPPRSLGPLGYTSPVHSFNFLLFAIMASLPVHLPLYEKSLNFSGTTIGAMAALFVLATVLVPPIWGYVVDRLADPRVALRIAMTGSTVFLLPCVLISHALSYFTFRFTASCFQGGLIPMTDSQSLAYGSKYSLRYGTIRVWGTIGFVVGQVVLAVLFFYVTDLRWLFLPWFLLSVLALGTTWRMEALPSGLKRGELLKSLPLLLDRPFATFCLGCVLHRIGMQGYYTFFSIYLTDLKLSFSLIALAWCVGPLSETVVIWYGHRMLNRIGVKGMLLLAIGAAVLRLLILASAPPTWIIFTSQLLHALTFGCMHIAGIMYVNHHFPSTMRASGQTAFNAVAIGLSGVIGSLLSGWLYDTVGPQLMLVCLASITACGFVFVVSFLRPVRIETA